MSDTDEPNLGRQFRERQQRDIANLTLAGLQRPAYSGVLLPMPDRKHRTWTCDILLDGYKRHLTLTVFRMRDQKSSGETKFQNWGRMAGLRPFFQRQDFELTEPDDHVSGPRLTGRIDLKIATLSVSVLSCTGANGDKIKIALLEVQREPVTGPDSHTHPR